jgi:signal transduction histidine kinase
MSKPLRRSFRDNLLIISLILTVIFAGMNGILYVLNQSYLEQKIESENAAFLELTTHMVEYNNIDVALEYVEHYTHIHAVEVEVTDEEDRMLFSSNISYRYSREYQIETTKGTFNVFMDNTDSTTVLTVNQNFLYVNLTLLSIYLIATILLYVVNKRSSKYIEDDVKQVVRRMNQEPSKTILFQFEEFRIIYDNVNQYLEKIDLLQEQKEMNVKGLAHDIKTPLTIIYGYIDKALKEQSIDEEASRKAFKAAKNINRLVDDLLEDNYEQNKHMLQLDRVLITTLNGYQDVFSSKGMTLHINTEPVTIKWHQQNVVRIIENLSSNAYQYSKSNSDVYVSLKQDTAIRLTIRSTPKDINQCNINQVFEKGYSESIESSKGLGLYITKLLLTQINGSIKARIANNEFIVEIVI